MTATLDPSAAELQTEPIVGWRVWSIVPWETVDGRKEPRLVAVSGGRPWPPGRPTEAVCISTERHDAPQVEHACGAYALRSETEACQLASVTVVGKTEYAIGRVSLWGRVIEHEHGWRAQFAYPYALTVVGDEKTARAIRDLYAVDVEHARPALAAPGKRRKKEKPRPPIPRLEGLDDDEVLVGVAAAVGARYVRGGHWRSDGPVCWTTDVLDGVLAGRGQARAWYKQPGYQSALAAVSKSLRRLKAAGLCELGRFGVSGTLRHCRLTPAGATRAAQVMPAQGVPAHDYHERITVKREDIRAAVALPVRLFEHEAAALAPEWKAVRRAAQAQGRDHYRTWLRTWRAESGENNRLPFDDDEVLAALAKMVEENEGDPVLAARVMDELAPGKWTLSEAGRMSRTLVQLRAAGKVDRAETPGKKRWTIV